MTPDIYGVEDRQRSMLKEDETFLEISDDAAETDHNAGV